MRDDVSILLVDDDEVDVMSVQRAFKKINITNPLYVANDGLEALALLRGEGGQEPIRPNIILLDLNMPRMGGLEFLEALRADDELKSISVVVLTTSDEETDRVKAFNHHVAGYIVKPVTSSKFVEAMATFNRYWTLTSLP
ncbi:MAG TPA: response regulator [Anaerolineae bacterium]|nr:response regulator [Anaerolineae bacterium]